MFSQQKHRMGTSSWGQPVLSKGKTSGEKIRTTASPASKGVSILPPFEVKP